MTVKILLNWSAGTKDIAKTKWLFFGGGTQGTRTWSTVD